MERVLDCPVVAGEYELTGYIMNESWMTEREQSVGGGLEERRVQTDLVGPGELGGLGLGGAGHAAVRALGVEAEVVLQDDKIGRAHV